jgi:CRISPR-associated endonuclease Cas1
MFSHKDIEYRSIFVVNSLEGKILRVQTGEFLLEDKETGKVLTKFPFQKILAIFIIGHTTITTPLIEKCTQFGISIVAMKPNFRPIFFFGNAAEANFLLRKKQYEYQKDNLQIPKILVANKIKNSIKNLEKTRLTNEVTTKAKNECKELLELLPNVKEYNDVMGIEGRAAKIYFSAYFADLNWKARAPRTKIDHLNATLDIGYTILFNYIEAFVRLFGFDLYRGFYHQLWFKRKSLICDLVEPFRCLIDKAIRKGLNLKQISENDFDFRKGEWRLKLDKNVEYSKFFYDVLIEHKKEIFLYMQKFYRAFMGNKSTESYPEFLC